jgi:hypothetical protein
MPRSCVRLRIGRTVLAMLLLFHAGGALGMG